jgi:hypothetical protein
MCGDDLDVFSVELCSGGTLTALIEFSHAIADLDLGLGVSSLNDIDSAYSVTDDEELSYSNSSLSPETVSISIEQFYLPEESPSDTSYRLTISVEGCAP